MVRWVKKVYQIRNSRRTSSVPYIVLPVEFREWIGRKVVIKPVSDTKIEVELIEGD